MTAFALGDVLARRGTRQLRQTGERVWRGSYDVEDSRAQVARPLGDGTEEGAKHFIRAYLISLEDYAEHTKQPGRSHEISANVVKLVRRIMWRCLDWKTGRCEVTLERIMEVTNFSRPTVVRLLAIARSWGFVDWVRRTERTGNAVGDGPQVKQTANAYFFEVSKLPTEAMRRLKQLLGPNGVRSWPERIGSGPVPRALVRKIRTLIRSLAGDKPHQGLAGPAQLRQVDARLDGLPRDQWAAVLFPDDPASQAWFAAETGLHQSQSASCEARTDSPP